MIEACFDQVLQAATAGADGMSRARAARSEYQRLAGAFEDSDPWYEERTQAFLDWFVLDWRDGPRGLTVSETAWSRARPVTDREACLALCRSIRGLFRVEQVTREHVALVDLCGSAAFVARPMGDPSGLEPGHLLDCHLIPWQGGVVLARGSVFHPRQAAAVIEDLVPRALLAGESREELLFALLRMRMRFDHYRGIRAERVYRYPFATFP